MVYTQRTEIGCMGRQKDVYKRQEIELAFREAMKSKKTPYVIEFEIDPEDLVDPMIQPGGTLKDMILDC